MPSSPPSEASWGNRIAVPFELEDLRHEVISPRRGPGKPARREGPARQ